MPATLSEKVRVITHLLVGYTKVPVELDPTITSGVAKFDPQRNNGSLLRLIVQPEPKGEQRGFRIVGQVAFLLPHRVQRGR
jgi:hypothetical protein